MPEAMTDGRGGAVIYLDEEEFLGILPALIFGRLQLELMAEECYKIGAQSQAIHQRDAAENTKRLIDKLKNL